jgi:two-component sensor histidine kinase
LTENVKIDSGFDKAMLFSNLIGAFTNIYIFVTLFYSGAHFAVLTPILCFCYFITIFFLVKKKVFPTKILFLIGTIVVILEVFICTHYLGWQSGFFFFIFLLPALFFLYSYWKLWITIAYNLIVVDSLLSIWLVFKNKTPLFFIPDDYTSFLSVLNLISTAVVTIMIIIFFRRSVDKKDAVLSRKNQELIVQNEEIIKQNEQQEILLKEIHHRVKNNLQVISSLISLQTHTVDDDSALSVLHESKRRIEAIALIHQKLYQDKRVNKVDFKSYLEDLLSSQARELISLKTDLTCPDDIELDLDIALPLGLILSELISNSIKHAYNDVEVPSISIVVNGTEPNYEITLKDNGVGLPIGFNFESNDSLGMEIIDALIGQINAKIVSFNQDGACFVISFKNK